MNYAMTLFGQAHFILAVYCGGGVAAMVIIAMLKELEEHEAYALQIDRIKRCIAEFAKVAESVGFAVYQANKSMMEWGESFTLLHYNLSANNINIDGLTVEGEEDEETDCSNDRD